MPLSKYNKAFGGKPGSAEKAHAAMISEYGAKKGERVFYATKNKKKMKSNKPKGASLSPKGDIGQHRGMEAVKVSGGGFKGAKVIAPSHYFKGSREQTSS